MQKTNDAKILEQHHLLQVRKQEQFQKSERKTDYKTLPKAIEDYKPQKCQNVRCQANSALSIAVHFIDTDCDIP